MLNDNPLSRIFDQVVKFPPNQREKSMLDQSGNTLLDELVSSTMKSILCTRVLVCVSTPGSTEMRQISFGEGGEIQSRFSGLLGSAKMRQIAC